MGLAEDNENFGVQPRRARIFQNPLRLTVSKAMIRSTKAAFRSMFSSMHFSCIYLSTEFMSVVPLLDLNQHGISDAGMSLFSKRRAKILPATENRVMPR